MRLLKASVIVMGVLIVIGTVVLVVGIINQSNKVGRAGGTAAARVLRERQKEGLHVAGTSAGAAILSAHMIAYGKEGSTPRGEAVALAPGIGVLDRVIVDQHFRQRDRLGRLLTAVAMNPRYLGLGIDENTAAVIAPDGTVEVVGEGSLTVVDGRDVMFTSAHEVGRNEPLTLLNVKLHILGGGATYNLETRTPDFDPTPSTPF